MDELFERDCRYVVCELNYDGQLVREVMRAAPDKRKVHFMGKSAELHTVAEVVAGLDGVARSGRIPELPYIWTEVRCMNKLAGECLGAGHVPRQPCHVC